MISIVEYFQLSPKNQIKLPFKNSWTQGYKQKINMTPKSLSGGLKVNKNPFKVTKPRMKI